MIDIEVVKESAKRQAPNAGFHKEKTFVASVIRGGKKFKVKIIRIYRNCSENREGCPEWAVSDVWEA